MSCASLELPYRVAINEAVEPGQAFGGTDGHKYVNGVLDKVAADLRPAEVRAHAAPRSGMTAAARHIEALLRDGVRQGRRPRSRAARPGVDPARGGEPMIFLNIGEPTSPATASRC